MMQGYNVKLMCRKIKLLKKTATDLKEISPGIQAVERNVNRILSNIAMLEKNVVDPYEVIKKKPGAK